MMKEKYAAMILGVILGISVLNGCTRTDTGKKSVEDSLFGEVCTVSDSSITIKVGTMKEMGQGKQPKEEEQSVVAPSDGRESEENETNKDKEQQPPQGGEPPSMLELTGEEREINFTDNTIIKRQGKSGRPEDSMDGVSGRPDDFADNGSNKSSQEEQSSESSDKEPPNNGETPEIPDEKSPEGERPDGEIPAKQEAEEITSADISEGDTVSITLDKNGDAGEITVMSFGRNMGKPGEGMAQSGGVEHYEAVTEYTTDSEVDGESIASTGKDENAIHILNGADVSLNDITVSRSSSDSTGGDNSSFYGIGAAILATDGNAYIKSSTIETDSAGGTGIFAYDKGTVYVADTDISTKQDTSGGIHAAGGGTLYAWDLDVETNGESSAAIRSDRGGGKMVVDGGSYISNGTGSPAIYSTADIAVNDAELTAKGSEAVCIEGFNSVHLYDSDLKGNMIDDSQNDCTWNVILYQSMSGDSEIGNSMFEMNGGTLKAGNGGMFYTTNTESTITLSNVNITYAEDSEFFLRCTGNHNQRGWGKSGENGADCLFTAVKQDMEGSIIWDSISKLDFYLTDGSTLKGAVLEDETSAGENGDGYSNLYIGEGCIWTVTGDSVLSRLFCAGTMEDENGKTVTVKGNDGSIYVEGDSSYTITVDAYEDTADLSGASALTAWEDVKVERPAGFE